MHKPRGRSRRGQVIAPLGLIIGALIIGVLGMFSFEVGRAVIGRDQLRAATDAAALAGAAAMASSDVGLDGASQTVEQVRTAARTAALAILDANDVMGHRLNDRQDGGGNPLAGKVMVNFRWLNPNANFAEVGPNDPNGRCVEVSAVYGYQPLFANLFGNEGPIVYPLGVASRGGVPQLDLVVCFDVSGSMGDLTKETHVKRFWDGTKVDYLPGASGGLRHGGWAYYPTQLMAAGAFSPDLRNQENGPPGNKDGVGNAVSDNSKAATFTDEVINLTEKDTFEPITDPVTQLSFPNVNVALEAARGNLHPDNYGNTKSYAQSAASALGGVPPDPRYKDAYERLARKAVEPLNSSQEAVKLFFQVLQKDAQSHFGFIAFTTDIGTAPDSLAMTGPNVNNGFYPRISSNYMGPGQGGTTPEPLPYIALSQSDDNFAVLAGSNNVIDTLVPANGTVFADALNKAIDDIQANKRKNSIGAILLFTDGINSDQTASRTAATRANSLGIPIYTIGLALADSTNATQQEDILTDDPAKQGIAGLSGNGAKFMQVKDQTDLRAVFQEMAVYLCQLVK